MKFLHFFLGVVNYLFLRDIFVSSSTCFHNGTCLYLYTNVQEVYKVPDDAHELAVKLHGGYSDDRVGSILSCILPVHAGQEYAIIVGKSGSRSAINELESGKELVSAYGISLFFSSSYFYSCLVDLW